MFNLPNNDKPLFVYNEGNELLMKIVDLKVMKKKQY
jgi:hypothetical protein